MKSNELTHIETKLYSIPLFGKKVGLRNIQYIMDALENFVNIGDLFEECKVIHVTGTNGKGSVSSMLSHIYTRSGYDVGLFTSPHIHQVNERVRFNNENVDEALFVEGYEVIKSIQQNMLKKDMEPTFFEWIFGIALYCFAVKKPDLLIIEVGIGGRLDTTNVIPRKDLCVLTPIGLDHQEILGSTISDIAVEKAGIIKKGNKVVFYNDNPEAESVVDRVAEELTRKYYKVLPKSLKIREHGLNGIAFSLHNKYYYYEKLRLSVAAGYQVENAAIALTAVKALEEELPVAEEHVIAGLEAFHWPGRFERIRKNLIIDGAHNELGIINLLESVSIVLKGHKPDLLIGMKDGKNIDQVLRLLKGADGFDKYFVVDMSIQKSVPKEWIANELKQNFDHVSVVEDLEVFLSEYDYDRQTLICAGSLYLISEIRQIILGG